MQNWPQLFRSLFRTPNNKNLRSSQRYELAIIVVLLAFAVRYALRSVLEEHAPFILFLPAIMIAAWLGGVGPALVATALGTLLAAYFFMLPFGSWGPLDATLAISAITYLLCATIALALVHTARKRTTQVEEEIEHRLRVEEELRQSEEHCRRIFECAAVGIVQLDPSARILRANTKFLEMVGYSLEELQGRIVYDIVCPEDRLRDTELFQKNVSGELPVLLREKRYIRKDGRTIWVRVTGTFLRDFQGNPECSISVVEEITARIEAETALRAAKEQLALHAEELEHRVARRTAALQASLADMERFCYSIAHDLRAPLRAMRGFTTALLEDCSHSLDDDGKVYCARVANAAMRMDAMITGLLEYGRISHSSVPIQSLDLGQEISEVLFNLKEDIDRTKSHIFVHEPLPHVCANDTLLGYVLLNLIGNGMKYVAPGTEPRVQIYAERRGQRVRFFVEDNGIGVAPEHQQRIFGVFERLHTHDVYPGTGIGLALVQKAVEKMRGTVGVQSKPGSGSRFWVELPSQEKCPCAERAACLAL